jgi:hypothetical protein
LASAESIPEADEPDSCIDLHPSRALKKKRDKTNYLNVKKRKEIGSA